MSLIPGYTTFERTSIDDVIVTDLLELRTPRAPRPAAERRSLRKLADALANEPRSILQVLAEVAMDVCEAGSAGISILEESEQSGRFRWHAIAGEFSGHLGGTTPRDFSPCGTTIDQNAPQLFSYPGRYFSYFDDVSPTIVEGLLVPFSVGELPLGTVWVVSHDETRQFDQEDARLLTTLATFASAGAQLVQAVSSAPGSTEAPHALPLRALSPREQLVLGMIVRGVRQKEIAFRLDISVKTVATHRARLLQKLDAVGSFDLLRYALDNKLVQWSEVRDER